VRTFEISEDLRRVLGYERAAPAGSQLPV